MSGLTVEWQRMEKKYGECRYCSHCLQVNASRFKQHTVLCYKLLMLWSLDAERQSFTRV